MTYHSNTCPTTLYNMESVSVCVCQRNQTRSAVCFIDVRGLAIFISTKGLLWASKLDLKIICFTNVHITSGYWIRSYITLIALNRQAFFLLWKSPSWGANCIRVQTRTSIKHAAFPVWFLRHMQAHTCPQTPYCRADNWTVTYSICSIVYQS